MDKENYIVNDTKQWNDVERENGVKHENDVKLENGVDNENYIVNNTKRENDVERENGVDRENVFVFWSLVFCLLGYGIIFFTFKFLVDFVNFLCAHIFFYPIFVGYSSLKMQIYVDLRTYPTLTSFSLSAHVYYKRGNLK